VGDAQEIVRRAMMIVGTVQGVGMRPFVFRIAHELGLTGIVRNAAGEVQVEAQGTSQQVEEFMARLQRDAPPGAHIEELTVASIRPIADERKFEILPSIVKAVKRPAIAPDLATCADCYAEMERSSTSRRAGYAFTSCSHCGPRYSIADDLPYDRATTTMRTFTMCEACSSEYSDPTDRRFHAQPIACPRCGPKLTLLGTRGNIIECGNLAVSRAATAIAAGSIVAMKGIGGFQLIVDATNPTTVEHLRDRKRRPDKPFALMMADAAAVQNCCDVSAEELRILTSPAAPIVLLHRRSSTCVAPNVAPGNPWLGVMVPCSPLHRLLLDECRRPLVCTSGNLSDEPICVDNESVLARLGLIADLFLTHNRAVARPLDDSVVRASNRGIEVIRRARGYTPSPIKVTSDGPVTLALGAHQKNTVGLAIGTEVILSQHIGDLSSAKARSIHRRTIDELLKFYGAAPQLLVCDLHPDYASTAVAEELAARFVIPLIRVQHHHAHIAASLAEHRADGPALGFAWDGAGYGTDGTIWGGEALRVDRGEFTRIAHLRTFPLIGGEAAIRDPRRAAVGLLLEAGSNDLEAVASRWFATHELRTFREMAERGLNSPRTSSVGRLFDAVAAIIGICERPSYDGQAAMQLECALDDDGAEHAGAYPLPLIQEKSVAIFDWAPLLSSLLADLRERTPVGLISARFHNALVEAAFATAAHVGLEQVALGGGCFQNRYLSRRLETRLCNAGFRLYRPHHVPANDGGLALGQIAVARNLSEVPRNVPWNSR
jgi:hydrogenase maturation protein HypF